MKNTNLLYNKLEGIRNQFKKLRRNILKSNLYPRYSRKEIKERKKVGKGGFYPVFIPKRKKWNGTGEYGVGEFVERIEMTIECLREMQVSLYFLSKDDRKMFRNINKRKLNIEVGNKKDVISNDN